MYNLTDGRGYSLLQSQVDVAIGITLNQAIFVFTNLSAKDVTFRVARITKEWVLFDGNSHLLAPYNIVIGQVRIDIASGRCSARFTL